MRSIEGICPQQHIDLIARESRNVRLPQTTRIRMFTLPPIARRAHIAPFIAMDVMRDAKALETGTLAREGRDIVHLEVGEPGAQTPPPIRAAAMNALAGERIAYTDALGLPRLREAISSHYKRQYALDVPASRVVVTTGSSGGFILAFLAMMDAGARIGIPAPGYPAYRNILAALGIIPVEIDCRAEAGHVLTAKAIEAAHAAHKLDAVLVMSPANPTGVLTPAGVLKDVAETCARLGVWLISDEIYHGLTYEGVAISEKVGAGFSPEIASNKRETTALAFSQGAVVVNSFSKYFCMTGWRVGWLVVPERLVRPLECLAQNLAISVPYLSQVAATAAFDATEDLEAIKAVYAGNRAILGAALPGMGLAPLPMDGAFYAYCDISRYSNDAMDFSRRALHEAGVAITPGLDFDPVEGNRFVRLSYAGSEAAVIEGVKRLKGWLK
jgi:aspartate/methionine/tyrosine aminotransferase